MDLKIAAALVGNLIERLALKRYEADSLLITGREVEALQVLLALRTSTSPTEKVPGIEAAQPSSGRSPEQTIAAPAIGKGDLRSSKFDLNKRAVTKAPDPNVTLCLDFGTAFSKAALWDQSKETGDPENGAGCCHALPIGRKAGEPELVYPISSSVYVLSDGMIHFGPAAVAMSIRENDPRRARFDNPKEHLSKAVRDTFYTQVLSPEFDPTGSGLTHYEVLQAFLAYLTWQASTAASQYGYDGLLRRRFAIPNWTGEKSDFVKKEMRRLLLNAQVLVDSIDPSLWSGGSR